MIEKEGIIRINRIRLEFKDINIMKVYSLTTFGINRIRLEFKEYSLAMSSSVFEVLIESDWNLKFFRPIPSFKTG